MCEPGLEWLLTDLSTELEVGHDDGHLGAGDDEDDKDEEEEAKEVVELILPDGSQDEEQLHKHRSEWEDTCYHRPGERESVWEREREIFYHKSKI